MRFHLTIEYRTNWGEEVRVVGSLPQLGKDKESAAIPLYTKDGTKWNLQFDYEGTQNSFSYYYLIVKGNKVLRREWNESPRNILFPRQTDHFFLIEDAWRNKPSDRFFYSSAFQNIWLKRNQNNNSLSTYPSSIIVKAYAPYLRTNEVLAICGNQDILGQWDPAKALIMSDITFPEWQQSIDYDTLTPPIAYKFVILDKETKELIAWEDNSNRLLPYPSLTKKQHLILADHFVRSDQGLWKGAGVATPVFSLRSKTSCGIGEFTDIKLLVDWANQTSLKLIQLLPINDTTQTGGWEDSYPYRCISVYALNPIYINLQELGIIDSKFKEEYIRIQLELNQSKEVNFPMVQKQKLYFLHKLYELNIDQTLQDKDYIEFYHKQKHWLQPYAAYCHFRKAFNTADTNKWQKYSTYQPQSIEKLFKPESEEYKYVHFYIYVQYHLYCQLKESSDYARQQGVVLKGDLPIGIGLRSVDAWMYPKLFNLNSQAGAPPDDFATQGQNWGFPTYNWAEITKDDFNWWKDRLKFMATFFDAYRIDHILGFFRIWSISSKHIAGILGQFYPAIPLTITEIESKGLQFNNELFIKPYIHKDLLIHIFHKKAKEITKYFFKPRGNGLLDFKEPFNSQAKIHAYFQNSKDNCFNQQVETVLLNIHSNVLFVEDEHIPNTFHPRIEAQKVAQYQLLTNKEKELFNAIYTDFFYYRHTQYWEKEAYSKLPHLIDATPMLVCGEDLGMIPSSVPWVMKELSILSLEITRMPKSGNNKLGDPIHYPYASVASFSTHDMPTMRYWWEQSEAHRSSMAQALDEEQLADTSLLDPATSLAILTRELMGQSIFSIQAIQDWLALTPDFYKTIDAKDEQINKPENAQNKWKYRIPSYLEDMLSHSALTNTIKTLINKTHRQ